MVELNVPDDAVKYILFQRTAYLRFTRNAVYQKLQGVLPASIYGVAVALEARLRRESVKAQYALDLAGEYATIRDHLPARCASVLDIGCGVAGIDVFLARHYGPDKIRLFLLDRTRTETAVFYGFKSKGAFYNSLDVAKALVSANRVPAEAVHLVEATDDNAINIDGPVDLIISLISWGFHYPVETYLRQAHSALADGGRLIIDVRKGTGGMEALRSLFPVVEVIVDSAKYLRIAASKSP